MNGAEVWPDGTFSLSVPVVTTDAPVFILMLNSSLSFSCLLTEGKETELYIDMVVLSRHRTPNNALESSQKQTVFFRGANADINNALQTEEVKSFDTYIPTQKWMKEIVDMSLDEYKAYYMDFYRLQQKTLVEKPFSTKVKEYLGIKLKQDVAHYLFFGDYHLENAFRKAHNLGRKDTLHGFNKPVFTEEYYSFLRELDMNNPKNLLSSDFSNNVNSCKFIEYHLYDINAVLYTMAAKELLKSKKVNRKEKKLLEKVSKIKKMQELQDIVGADNLPLWNEIQKKYKFNILVMDQSFPPQKQIGKMMGTDKGIVFDLWISQMFCDPLEKRTLIHEADIRIAEQQLSSPFFASYMKEKNAELAVALEAEKQQGGYTVHQAGESLGEALLVDIVQQFKGKVIFIDVWATWCGPCRSAMTMFEPAKEKLKEQGVVFVYLTDHTSPEKTWENMIPNIKGEHFRLKNGQFSSLMQLFGFTGIPSYLIINKKGEVVYSHMGFEGNEKITELLLEEIKK